jgi:hypothetical protein
MSQKQPMETRGHSPPLDAAGRASCPVKISASGPAAQGGGILGGHKNRTERRASSFDVQLTTSPARGAT